jgi:hypothetical protein
MKKEVSVAIFIGLTFGIIITVGLYRARLSSLNRGNQTKLSPSPAPEASGANSSLVLNSPEDESIQSTKGVTVAGTTTPHAYVVVFINNQDFFTTADSTGHFSLATDLEAGSNVITIHAIDEDGRSTVEEKTVIYSTTGLEENPVSTSSAEVKTDANKL